VENSTKSLQDTYAPKGICFGCGCLNSKGLQLKSYVDNNLIYASFLPDTHHEAFPGILNGGIIGSVLDCHSNWAAAYFLMKEQSLSSTPCTVTADYSVKLHRPTPTTEKISVFAKLDRIDGNKAWIDAHMSIDEIKYASCKGLFVAVDKDHPAYHRW